MVIYIGEKPSSCTVIKKIDHIRDAEDIEVGDFAEFWGYVLKKDEHCVDEEACRRWRSLGDPLCDDALDYLLTSTTNSSPVGKDLLAWLTDFVEESPGDNHSASNAGAANAFYDEIHSAPPLELQASEEEIKIARAFFLDHAFIIMQSLLHYSLAAGFASGRIVKTLRAVSYLVPSYHVDDPNKISDETNERTFSRLVETFQFVLDIMGCVPDHASNGHGQVKGSRNEPKQAYLMPGGEGWKAAVRVRMLHGVARRRAKGRLNSSRPSPNNTDVPISQEDMSATLGAFCILPLWCIDRLEISSTPTQSNAFLATWRHIGFYLGVHPSILSRYFTNKPTADSFLATIVLDLFSEDENDTSVGETTTKRATPGGSHVVPTLSILRAISNRPPTYSSFEYNCAVTRFFAGSELADHLGVPETSPWMSIKLHTVFFIQKIPIQFSKYYPRRGWKLKRREVMSEGMLRSVRWSLGMRKTMYRPRTEVRDPTLNNQSNPNPDLAANQSKEDIGGLLSEEVKAAENVVPDYVGGEVLVKKWREMMIEIMVVTAIVGVGVAFLMWEVIPYVYWNAWS